jgi:transposase
MAKRSRRRFTAEFKASKVALVRKGEKSIGEIAKELGLTETSLRLWVKLADINARRGPVGALTTDERAELVRLRRENKVLQME